MRSSCLSILKSYLYRDISENPCFSVQQCLLSILEKWKYAIDNTSKFGSLLTDLSKSFDCLLHDLLIAKLSAYKFLV